MPVTKSAQKAKRRNQRRRKINLLTRRKIKEAAKLFQKKPDLDSLSKFAQSLDRAAKKKVIHQNKAARLKSKAARKIKKGLKTPTR